MNLTTGRPAWRIRYIVVDYMTLHSHYDIGFLIPQVSQTVPVAPFENPLAGAFPYLLDQVGFYAAQEIRDDPRSRKIYIFDIDDIMQPKI